MGDIADMVLNGDLCERCGVDLGDGDGFPRKCAGCDDGPQPYTGKLPTIRAKDGKWLETIARRTENPLGMYPGESVRDIPSGPADRLRALGLIEKYYPHNDAHDDRWTVTPKGTALAAEVKART